MSKTQQGRRRSNVGAGILVVVVLVVGGLVWWMLGHADTAPQASPAVPVATPEATPDVVDPPAPPMPAGPVDYPADGTVYDIATLPPVAARAVVPVLEVDAAPDAAVLPYVATATGPSAPLFAAPGSPPVAQLLREQQYDGTTVPIVEHQPNWVKVLLPARSGLPSEGVVGQQVGWLRVADVTVTASTYTVSVSLSAGTLAITNSGAEVFATTTFGYGAAATPTPLGRTFIMTTFNDPDAAYARGLPFVALAVQSPTLDGFLGQDVAVTAFHYHDVRSGTVSNGCVRVDEATILALAALPLGTPVVITA